MTALRLLCPLPSKLSLPGLTDGLVMGIANYFSLTHCVIVANSLQWFIANLDVFFKHLKIFPLTNHTDWVKDCDNVFDTHHGLVSDVTVLFKGCLAFFLLSRNIISYEGIVTLLAECVLAFHLSHN